VIYSVKATSTTARTKGMFSAFAFYNFRSLTRIFRHFLAIVTDTVVTHRIDQIHAIARKVMYNTLVP